MVKFMFLMVVFINAFIDVGHKIILQNTAFKVYDGSEQIIFTTIINGLILLPFILMFSPSGFISNKYPKDKVIKYSSFGAILISVGMMISYYYGTYYISFGLLFLLALQSAIYSPAKFGYIKSLYGKNEISKGNSFVQSMSTISILFSLAIFSYFFEKILSINNSEMLTGINKTIASLSTSDIMTMMFPLSIILFVLSVIEFLMTLKLPNYEKIDKTMKFKFSEYIKFKLLGKNIKSLKTGDGVFMSIIGLSIFLGITQGIIAVFPAYAKEYLDITNTLVVNGMIASAGIGIAIGSFMYSRFSKHFIELGTVPIATFSVTLVLILILNTTNHYLIFALFISYGLMGGLYLVPLNSLIQFNTHNDKIGSTLAGNNWFQSIFMLTILALTALMSHLNVDSKSILYSFSIIMIFGSFYTIYKLPQSLIQFLLSRVIQLRYKLNIYDIDKIPSECPVLFLGNHISFLDWAIIQMASPRRIKFVMDRGIYEKWYLKYFLDWFGAIPISSSGSSESMKTIAKELDNGSCVCIFPEGAITKNGNLGEFKKGFEKILTFTESEDIKILPFYIRGLWGTIFGKANEYYYKNVDDLFEVSITYGKPLDKNSSSELVKQKVFDLSILSWKKNIDSMRTIPYEIIKRAKITGSKMSMADSTGLSLSGNKFIGLSVTLRNIFKKKIKGQNVGIIVPSTVIGNVVNMSLLMLGKTIVNLNYTSSIESLISSIEIAEIKSIIVSRKFIEKAKNKGFDLYPLLEKVEVLYLEDLKSEMSKITVLKNIIKTIFLSDKLISMIWVTKREINDTAAILFSSGSEGTPKGIELSHKNLIGNIKQISNVIEANENDVIIGNLPLFHAFGITVTTLLPMVEGIPVVSHPDPTDGFGVAKLIYKYNVTIMAGTSTFFRLYTNNKKIVPLMFDSIRVAISGAEKLDDKVRKSFKEKYGKDIMEGYGATETSPVATVNLPDRLDDKFKVQKGYKLGTVGMPVPGTSIKIVDPQDLNEYLESNLYSNYFKSKHNIDEKFLNYKLKELEIGEEGMILIGGTQIMKGYLKNEDKTKEVLVKIDGNIWYVSGDKGMVDEDGFVTIVDRYSRFAKLGGEMISLTTVENKVKEIINHEEFECMAINQPDDKKGEKILLIYTHYEDDGIQKLMRESFDNKLMLPYKFLKVDEIPKLGTGKSDFKTAKILYKDI